MPEADSTLLSQEFLLAAVFMICQWNVKIDSSHFSINYLLVFFGFQVKEYFIDVCIVCGEKTYVGDSNLFLLIKFNCLNSIDISLTREGQCNKTGTL